VSFHRHSEIEMLHLNSLTCWRWLLRIWPKSLIREKHNYAVIMQLKNWWQIDIKYTCGTDGRTDGITVTYLELASTVPHGKNHKISAFFTEKHTQALLNILWFVPKRRGSCNLQITKQSIIFHSKSPTYTPRVYYCSQPTPIQLTIFLNSWSMPSPAKLFMDVR